MTYSDSDYVWGTGFAEQQRLLQQVDLYAPAARWLLDQVKIRPGSRVVDLGCGPLGILDLLAERVGRTGEVFGLESELRFVEMARRLLAERKVEGVQLRAADANATGLPSDSFQFVHERLLLIVLPDPKQVVAEMVRLAQPDGVVAVEDVDIGTWTCEPPHPAWTRLFNAVETIYCLDGKELRIGRRLPGMLRAAGLQDVECKAHANVNGPGDFHQQQLLVFVKLFWRQIVKLGLIDEVELHLLFRQLEEHLANDGTLVVSPLLFQSWGKKPLTIER